MPESIVLVVTLASTGAMSAAASTTSTMAGSTLAGGNALGMALDEAGGAALAEAEADGVGFGAGDMAAMI